MKRALKLFSLILVVLILSACGNNDGDTNESTGNEVDDFSVKMVTDTSGVDDKSFNESAWEGLTKFEKDFGVEVGYVQSESASDYLPNMTTLARDDTSLIFGVGFVMADDVREVALQFPDKNFAIIDSVVTDENGDFIPNIANISFAEHEGSFLVGIIAGMQTKTNVVGFIGGVESDLIKKFENGFKAGVKTVNPDAEIMTQYVQNFNDAALGQQIADTMYDNGADIIYHAAGGSGNGLFTAAINRARQGEEVWVIGVDQDQHEEGQWDGGNVTLSSMIKRVNEAVYQVSQRTYEGNFPGGEVLEFGLDVDGVGIAETQDNVTEESLQLVEEYKQKIIDKELEVPKTDEEYEQYVNSL